MTPNNVKFCIDPDHSADNFARLCLEWAVDMGLMDYAVDEEGQICYQPVVYMEEAPPARCECGLKGLLRRLRLRAIRARALLCTRR